MGLFGSQEALCHGAEDFEVPGFGNRNAQLGLGHRVFQVCRADDFLEEFLEVGPVLPLFLQGERGEPLKQGADLSGGLISEQFPKVVADASGSTFGVGG